MKSVYNDTFLQHEEVRRENKTLFHNIKNIIDQISEGGNSIHEIDKISLSLSFRLPCPRPRRGEQGEDKAFNIYFST